MSCALWASMPAPKYSNAETASSFVATYGVQAPQKVVDQIIACVREHDIASAKRWEEVGRTIDHVLDANPSEIIRQRSA